MDFATSGMGSLPLVNLADDDRRYLLRCSFRRCGVVPADTVTVPSNARTAARMWSGSVGHAATSAANSGSTGPPSVLWVRPVVRPTGAADGKALSGKGLESAIAGLIIAWFRV